METIDLTPSWAGVMPVLVACLEDGTDEGKKIAREELARLAKAMDARRERSKLTPWFFEGAWSYPEAEVIAVSMDGAHIVLTLDTEHNGSRQAQQIATIPDPATAAAFKAAIGLHYGCEVHD